MAFFGMFQGLVIAASFSTLNTDISIEYLNLAGTLGFIVNFLGRIGFGAVFDKYGFKKTFTVIMVLQLISNLLIYPLRKSPYCYIFFVCLSLMTEGAHFVLFPGVSATIFGN